MPIDYSKWDKLEVSDSEEETGSSPAPRVTRLDQESRVTRTVDGSLVVEPSQAPFISNATTTANKVMSLPKDEQASWTVKGGHCRLTAAKTNVDFYWSQDATSCNLRLALPPGLTSKHLNCSISDALRFADRHTAVTTSQKQVLTVTHHQTIVLQDQLAYPVYLMADEDEVDWSLERDIKDNIYLVVSLHKATPMAGLTLWWKRPLTKCPEIELDWRNKGNGAFAAAWKEAHQQFLDQRYVPAASSTQDKSAGLQ